MISTGRQLKLTMAEHKEDLAETVQKQVAHEMAKNLEAVYGPLLEMYKSKCAWLEEQLPCDPAAQPSPAQEACTPPPVPQQQKQALWVCSQPACNLLDELLMPSLNM